MRCLQYGPNLPPVSEVSVPGSRGILPEATVLGAPRTIVSMLPDSRNLHFNFGPRLQPTLQGLQF